MGNIKRGIGLWAAVWLVLAAAYTITYTGRMELADQLEYFDAVGGMARFGQAYADEGLWQSPPTRFSPDAPPLRPTIADPLFIFAAAPLYALSEALPQVGLVHGVWLFNIIVMPLVAVGVGILARQTGAGWGAAVLSALAFGLLTVAWTYSQTFFREPLMMALTVGGVAALYRAVHQRRMGWGVLGALLLVGAFFTKDMLVFMLPGLVVWLMPSGFWHDRRARWAVVGLIVLSVIACLLMVYTPVLYTVRDLLPDGELFGRFLIEPDISQMAVHTYLLSVGGSVWGTSPIVLLAVPGVLMLWRRGQVGVAAGGLLVMFGIILGYGLLRGGGTSANWFGGTVWPQRFLLPAIPFLVVLCAPVIQAAMQPGRWTLRAGVGVLAVYSLFWQVFSVAFNWSDYDAVTAPLSLGLTYWLPGFNELAYIRPVALAGAIGQYPLNWAWARAEVWLAPVLSALWMGVGFWALWRLMIGRPARWIWLAVVFMPVVWWVGLAQLYPSDPLYLAERADLHAAAASVVEQVEPGGVVLLNSPDTTYFWFNYGKVGPRWVVGLPYHPGDRGSFDQPLLVDSPNPALGVADPSEQVIGVLAEQLDLFTLFMDSSAEIPWAVRPLERFMGERYYRLSEQRFSPYARLLTYSTTRAPRRADPVVPEHAARYTFTDPGAPQPINLVGVTLPNGDTYAPGDVLPVSSVWEADQPASRDYSLALFLINEQNPSVRVQAEDSWLGATFKTTTLLEPNQPVWDNRALYLPADLPPGEYRLGFKLYWFDPDTGTITDLAADGADVREADIAFAPVVIRVGAP